MGIKLEFSYEEAEQQEDWEEYLRLSLCLSLPTSSGLPSQPSLAWNGSAPVGQKGLLAELVGRSLTGIHKRIYMYRPLLVWSEGDIEVIEAHGMIDENMRGLFAEAWRSHPLVLA